ncbi:MAG: alpha/beta fold hydrolase [Gammaproteobacteria bacterium]|nr:alpha/beta fold hydrolase [Gammaproteobacteria bacterium]
MRINGAKLWYDVRGPAHGAPILLHHGYTASRVNWMPVAERLDEHHRVILMECRGTGASEHTSDGYTLEQYAADVVGLLDQLGLERVTFAGHSMGGGIGYVLALNHAARLDRLVLMAPVAADGFRDADPAPREARRQLRLARDRTALMAQYRAASVRRDVESDAWFESRIDHVLGVSDGHFDGGAVAMRNLDVGSRLTEITLPVLMIAGSADGLLAANLKDFARLPNATLQVFARAGHEVAIHEPVGVAQVIDEFLRFGLARPTT